MKIMLLATTLMSFNAFASGAALMAGCTGKIDGQNIKVNVYLDPEVYCHQTYRGPYKGYIVFDEDTLVEANINYQEGNYSAQDVTGQVTITFDSMNVPSTNAATMSYNTEDETAPVKLTCRMPEYHMDCRNIK